MKIALLSYEYPPETGNGGIGTYTWYQARALVKLGHSVHVLAGTTANSGIAQSEEDEVRVFRYRANGLLMRGAGSLERFGFWWSRNRMENAFSMFELLRRLNRTHRYDVVEMPECGAEGLLVNRFINVPSVVRLHSPARLIMPFYDVKPGDIRLCSFLEQQAIQQAKALTACSNFISKESRNVMGLHQMVHVIPNGIDVDLYKKSMNGTDALKQLDLPKDKPLILFSGRMEKRKGIFECKEIVSTLLKRNDACMVLAGEDLFHHVRDDLMPYWNGQTFRGTVRYIGKVDQHTIRSLLRRTDILLFPSLWENCPYSCLEAMASGCAVVSTNQGGMPEIIQHGQNGMLAKNGERQSYVESIEQLLQDPAFREKIGAKARQTVLNSFRDVTTAERSVQIYRALI